MVCDASPWQESPIIAPSAGVSMNHVVFNKRLSPTQRAAGRSVDADDTQASMHASAPLTGQAIPASVLASSRAGFVVGVPPNSGCEADSVGELAEVAVDVSRAGSSLSSELQANAKASRAQINRLIANLLAGRRWSVDGSCIGSPLSYEAHYTSVLGTNELGAQRTGGHIYKHSVRRFRSPNRSGWGNFEATGDRRGLSVCERPRLVRRLYCSHTAEPSAAMTIP